MTAPRIVIVDDEADLRDPVVEYLQAEGLAAFGADGGGALDAILATAPVDLVVLDVNMPGEDGFSIARRLRAERPIGIIMLTAKRDLVDRVVGLEIGADDYLTKPFEPRELLARIRAVLRRASAAPAQPAGDGSRAAEPSPGTAATTYAREFWAPGPQGRVRVPVSEIEWIEASRDYAVLHTRQRGYTVRATMADLARQLDPDEMLRVHRSAFVRLDAVTSIRQVGHAVTLTLASGAAAPVGPNYVEDVKHRLKT